MPRKPKRWDARVASRTAIIQASTIEGVLSSANPFKPYRVFTARGIVVVDCLPESTGMPPWRLVSHWEGIRKLIRHNDPRTLSTLKTDFYGHILECDPERVMSAYREGLLRLPESPGDIKPWDIGDDR